MHRCELVLDMLIVRFVICRLQLFEQSRLAERASRDVLGCLTYLTLHVIIDARMKITDDPEYLTYVCEDEGNDTDDADQVVRGFRALVFNEMVVKTEHAAMIR